MRFLRVMSCFQLYSWHFYWLTKRNSTSKWQCWELKPGLWAWTYLAPKAALITAQQWSLRWNGHTPGSTQDDPFACGKNIFGYLLRFLSRPLKKKSTFVAILYLHKRTMQRIYIDFIQINMHMLGCILSPPFVAKSAWSNSLEILPSKMWGFY